MKLKQLYSSIPAKACALFLCLAGGGSFVFAADPTPVSALKILPGFKIDLIRKAEAGEGSWVCMTIGPRGRIIVSSQEGGLMRLTLSGDGQVTAAEKLDIPITGAQGLLRVDNSLYVSGKGANGMGLYRLKASRNDDKFENLEFLKKFEGSGEHGPHGLTLGPDGKIYIMNGNHTKVPDGIAPHSPHRNYAEDLLLPRQWDANGHAVGIMAPGGYVLRTDKDGKEWELFCAGFRNAYDLDFNPEGDLFTYDSDMEWDWGTPWYRPTRVYLCVSGGEYGWRSGTGKWPKYYPDALPGVLDVGIGSPTGVKFGTKSNFPYRYKSAFYIADWTYGRILAVHLQKKGSTYSATMEPFVSTEPGKPLNISDIEFGKDGAMYFITGGRGTQSALYRVASTARIIEVEPKKTEKELAMDQTWSAYRELRKKLESYHGKNDPSAIEFIWRFLNNGDMRRIRFIARIALESQDVSLWKDRALSEQRTDAAIAALTALARVGSKEVQNDLLEALDRLRWDDLTEDQQLRGLRALQLCLIRMGKPDTDTVNEMITRLDAAYPSKSPSVNRELCQLLVFLEAPTVVAKSLELMAKAKTQEDQLFYIFTLRNVKSGWTLDQRKTYFNWFNRDRSKDLHPPELVQWFRDVGQEYKDGASFGGFMKNIKKDAVATLNEEELAPIIDGKVASVPPSTEPLPQEWSAADLEKILEDNGRKRNWPNGKALFAKTQCLACHRFGNEGGSAGPDLSAVSSRFTRRDVLSSILEPSRVLSEQFQNIMVTRKDGSAVSGRIMDVDAKKLVIAPSALSEERIEVPLTEIVRQEPSPVSPMPEGLLTGLSKDDVLDLLSYIESGGKEPATLAVR
jgi:putative heme-binding domain-containing protein